MSNIRRVISFGTFDHFHPGHAAYLSQAASLGDELIVVVARDVNVLRIKNKEARHKEGERLQAVADFLNKQNIKGEAVLGGEDDRWQVLNNYRPDIIALGYDQPLDEKYLKQYLKLIGLEAEVKRLDSYKPEQYKSSFMKD